MNDLFRIAMYNTSHSIISQICLKLLKRLGDIGLADEIDPMTIILGTCLII